MSFLLNNLVRFGRFVFDIGTGDLECDGQSVEIPPRSVVVLRYLLEHRDRLVSMEELKAALWPGLEEVEEGSIRKQVSDLRRVLDKAAGFRTRFIKNGYGRGWQFVTEVREVTSELVNTELQSGEFSHHLEISNQEPADEVVAAKNQAAGVTTVKKQAQLTRLWIGLVAATVICLAGILGAWLVRTRVEVTPAVEYRQVTNDGRLKMGPLFTDGKRIYYAETVGNMARICRVPVNGGERKVVLDRPDLAGLKSISPDGRFLVYVSDEATGSSLWAMPTDGGKPQPLMALSGEVSWSPNGQRVAFSALPSKSLSFRALRADSARRITEWSGADEPDGEVQVDGVIRSIQWSPDSRRVRLTVSTSSSGTACIWEVDPERQSARKIDWLSAGNEFAGYGSWSLDGRNFFYQGDDRFHTSIYAIAEKRWFPRLGQAKPVVLTNGSGTWEFPLALADNSGIAAINSSRRSELVSLDEKSGTWRAMWGGGQDYELDYSPDGKWVVFTHLPEHTIWKCRADGSERTRLTEDGIEAHQAHWSRDGLRIAFMGKAKSGNWRVHVVLASGGNSEVLLDQGADQGVPTWSADGRYIAFGDLLSPEQGPRMAVRLMDVATREMTELEHSRGLWSPRWSPDGKLIAAVTCDSKAIRIHAGPGSGWREIARMVFVDNARWSADSKYVCFNGRQFGLRDYAFFRVKVADGKVAKLADLRSFKGAYENWYGVTPDGKLLAAQGAISTEIWALKFRMP